MRFLKMIRKNRVWISLVVICVFVALATIGTHALYTKQANIKNHISSGNLNIGLNRLSTEEYHYDSTTGSMIVTKDDTKVEVGKTEEPLFKMENSIPSCYKQIELEVVNKGNISFEYAIELSFDTTKLSEAQQEFAKQIEITVSNEKGVIKTFILNDANNEEIKIGVLNVDNDEETTESARFVVKALFKNMEGNNSVQGTNLDFDLLVKATQHIAE